MNIWRLHITILIAATALALAGCNREDAGGADGDRVTITFWHSFVQSTRPALEKLIDRFHDEHPQIRISAQYIPTGDALVQKLITAVQSGTAPDISWIHSHYMEDLVRADAIYEMSHFIQGENGLSDTVMADIYPALIQYASWRGTLYSMPMEATNLGMLYNKDHYRDVGLDPERPAQSWEEIKEHSRRLLYDRNGDGRYERIGFFVPAVPADGPQGAYMMWQFLPFLWQAGGYYIAEDQSRVLFAEEPGVKALTFWKELYDMQNQRSFPSQYEITVMASKQVAFYLDGPWNLPRFPQVLRGIDWGIAMLPEGPERRATVVAGEYLAIFKQSRFPDEAWEFVKWVIRPEVQAFWSMESGYLPMRRSVSDVAEFQEFLEENPAQRVFVEQMEYARAQRPTDYHALAIQRLLARAIERATVGGADPRQALEQAAAEANRLLATADRS